jgi:3-oxoacyl-[acyl-carrier protein] reductase
MTEESERRVALVSGGSRGIGRAIALKLAEDGYDISFCYRSDEQAATEVEKLAGELGVRALAARVDVADSAAVKEWVDRTEKELGEIAVAVTSAGITRDQPLVLMTDDQWQSVLRTNLDGVYHVCRNVAFAMMKRKSGAIINLSSVSGVYGNPTQTNYSASKAGIIGFSRALAKEVGRYKIRVNSVAPGIIDTEMTREMTDAAREKMMKVIPLKRFGEAREVAELVAFLASDKATYITGSTFQIDGGITV